MRSERSARNGGSSGGSSSGGSSGGNARTRPVLDQGIVITGDVLVKLMGLNLLPVRVRLLVSSTKLARELGLDWWRDEQAAGDEKKERPKRKRKVTSVFKRRDGDDGNRLRRDGR